MAPAPALDEEWLRVAQVLLRVSAALHEPIAVEVRTAHCVFLDKLCLKGLNKEDTAESDRPSLAWRRVIKHTNVECTAQWKKDTEIYIIPFLRKLCERAMEDNEFMAGLPDVGVEAEGDASLFVLLDSADSVSDAVKKIYRLSAKNQAICVKMQDLIHGRFGEKRPTIAGKLFSWAKSSSGLFTGDGPTVGLWRVAMKNGMAELRLADLEQWQNTAEMGHLRKRSNMWSNWRHVYAECDKNPSKVHDILVRTLSDPFEVIKLYLPDLHDRHKIRIDPEKLDVANIATAFENWELLRGSALADVCDKYRILRNRFAHAGGFHVDSAEKMLRPLELCLRARELFSQEEVDAMFFTEPISSPQLAQILLELADIKHTQEDRLEALSFGVDRLLHSQPRTPFHVLEYHPVEPYRIMRVEPFVGRQLQYDQLLKFTLLPTDTSASVVGVVRGPAGIGKSALVAEYLQDLRTTSVSPVDILEIDASSDGALRLSMLALRSTLKDLVVPPDFLLSHVIDSVVACLSTHPSWVLVLDNLDDASIHRRLSKLLKTLSGKVLITTRLSFAEIPRSACMDVAVPPLVSNFAKELIVGRSGLPADREQDDLDWITGPEALGGHPLALSQAGAFLADTTGGSFAMLKAQLQAVGSSFLQGRSCVSFEDFLRIRHAFDYAKVLSDAGFGCLSLLTSEVCTPSALSALGLPAAVAQMLISDAADEQREARSVVASSFAITTTRLSSPSRDFLKLLAAVARSAVPEELVLHAGYSRSESVRIWDELCRLSLVSRHSSSSPGDGHVYHISALLQSVILAEITPSGLPALLDAAARALTAALPAKHFWQAHHAKATTSFRSLVPHIERVVGLYDTQTTCISEPFARLILAWGWACSAGARVTQVLSYLENVVRFASAKGKDAWSAEVLLEGRCLLEIVRFFLSSAPKHISTLVNTWYAIKAELGSDHDLLASIWPTMSSGFGAEEFIREADDVRHAMVQRHGCSGSRYLSFHKEALAATALRGDMHFELVRLPALEELRDFVDSNDDDVSVADKLNLIAALNSMSCFVESTRRATILCESTTDEEPVLHGVAVFLLANSLVDDSGRTEERLALLRTCLETFYRYDCSSLTLAVRQELAVALVRCAEGRTLAAQQAQQLESLYGSDSEQHLVFRLKLARASENLKEFDEVVSSCGDRFGEESVEYSSFKFLRLLCAADSATKPQNHIDLLRELERADFDRLPGLQRDISLVLRSSIFLETGRYTEAYDTVQEALTSLRSQFGLGYPWTQKATNLWIVMHQVVVGRDEALARLLLRLARLHERLFGPQDNRTRQAWLDFFDLVVSFRETIPDACDCSEELERVCQMSIKHFGEFEETSLKLACRRAVSLRTHHGNDDAYFKCITDLVDRTRKALPLGDPAILVPLAQIAEACERLDYHEKEVEVLQELLAKHAELYGPTASETIQTGCKLAHAFCSISQRQRANDLLAELRSQFDPTSDWFNLDRLNGIVFTLAWARSLPLPTAEAEFKRIFAAAEQMALAAVLCLFTFCDYLHENGLLERACDELRQGLPALTPFLSPDNLQYQRAKKKLQRWDEELAQLSNPEARQLAEAIQTSTQDLSADDAVDDWELQAAIQASLADQ